MAALLTLLREWVAVSYWLPFVIWAVWVAKDLAFLPKIRAVERSRPKTGFEGLIGQKGVVRQSLEPEGWVWLRGELWRAEAVPEHLRLDAGIEVRVENVRGLTLLVRPASATAH
jgi:membrane protein implicated in regulation of membrane protease activity